MKPSALICGAILLGQGCFTLHTVTRHGEPLNATQASTEFHACYEEVAVGADFENHWAELHDGLARRWVGCLKARGIRIQGGDHPITAGPAATLEAFQRDYDACSVTVACGASLSLSCKSPNDQVTELDQECFGRKGYITASLAMLAELSPDEP